MTQGDFDRLPWLVGRKEFMAGSGLGQDQLDGMRKRWMESRDKRKGDLGRRNLKRLLMAGMMPVWVPPTAPGKKVYCKYYKVVMGLLAGIGD